MITTMRPRLLISALLIIPLAGGIGWLVYDRALTSGPTDRQEHNDNTRPIPVDTAQIQQRPISLRRHFTGTLEARAEFTVSPKIDGRIVELDVDLGDSVVRDQVVARLDDAEHHQSVAQAEADLAVAQANLAEARSLLVIAERELERLDRLSKQGVSSVSQRDTAKAEQLAKKAHVQVTQAQVTRAQAQLEAARIRLGYTQVRAAWRGGDETRVVAERFLDEGETVSANAPLLRIVELDPITAVFYVTERDYARLQQHQPVELTTDTYPGKIFSGQISRIAPVFRENTRQARVEVSVANSDLQLKPGMYARANVVLESVAKTTVLPEQALTTRDETQGVFVVTADNRHVRWQPIHTGIREGGMIQVSGEGLTGRVVILGQQLLKDGSAVIVETKGAAK